MINPHTLTNTIVARLLIGLIACQVAMTKESA
jgi:hypothetical protein